MLGQPSLCTGQLQGLIFTNVLFKKCSCVFRTFMHRARGPRHRYKIAFLGIIQAKGGGQVVVTFLSWGHTEWHRVKPCACHLSLGLSQEPSNQSLHPSPLSALRLILHPPPLHARPGWLPERARDHQSPTPASDELKIGQQRETWKEMMPVQ